MNDQRIETGPPLGGIDAGDWVDPSGENRKVRVRLSPESRRRAADIEQLPTRVPLGNEPPSAWDASSITIAPCLSAIRRMAGMSHARPAG